MDSSKFPLNCRPTESELNKCCLKLLNFKVFFYTKTIHQVFKNSTPAEEDKAKKNHGPYKNRK